MTPIIMGQMITKAQAVRLLVKCPESQSRSSPRAWHDGPAASLRAWHDLGALEGERSERCERHSRESDRVRDTLLACLSRPCSESDLTQIRAADGSDAARVQPAGGSVVPVTRMPTSSTAGASDATQTHSAGVSGPTRSGVDAIRIPGIGCRPPGPCRRRTTTARGAAQRLRYPPPVRHAAAAAPGTARSREAATTAAAAATRRRGTHAARHCRSGSAALCGGGGGRAAQRSVLQYVKQEGREGTARPDTRLVDLMRLGCRRSGLADHLVFGSKPTRILGAGRFDSDILTGCHTNGSFREQLQDQYDDQSKREGRYYA
jgi:hypothetical protein